MSTKGEHTEKGDKPVKQLLFKANQPSSSALRNERAPKQPMRTSSDSSEIMDFGKLQEQIDTMCSSIMDLREDLKSVVKKEEIEECLTRVMTGIEARILKDFEKLVDHNVQEVKEKVDSLEFKYQSLQEHVTQLGKQHEELESMEIQMSKTNDLAKEANKKANYNEQYSRKNNVKIMDVKIDGDESSETLITNVPNPFNNQGVILEKQDIMAIHRIPGRKGSTKPVLFKLMNNSVKSNLMKKRKTMKEAGNRIADDVTKLNSGLISQLTLHHNIDSAWFFSGSVYGQTTRQERVKFDIYDNIDNVIENFRFGQRTYIQDIQ
ncbi:hypothetical protein DPMN_093823 [Dreissena polymorpha]|uniref:Uncharacterized protein n=1 Tax=Dreissena polymorpha TaxID=45954 RepID=A0A9D4L4X2_DREPO|nr:hypothetical protein DPMN_093823 [Dreissena polymorpha]